MEYLNEIIYKYFSNQKFKIWKVDGKEKINSDATKEFNLKLFKQEIGTIFSKPLSEKYKAKNKQQNIINIKKLTERYPFFKELFKIPFNIFYKYKFLLQEGDEENILQSCFEKEEINIEKKDSIRNIKMKNLESFIKELRTSGKHKEGYIKELEKNAKDLLYYFDPTNSFEMNLHDQPDNNNVFQLEGYNNEIETNKDEEMRWYIINKDNNNDNDITNQISTDFETISILNDNFFCNNGLNYI